MKMLLSRLWCALFHRDLWAMVEVRDQGKFCEIDYRCPLCGHDFTVSRRIYGTSVRWP